MGSFGRAQLGDTGQWPKSRYTGSGNLPFGFEQDATLVADDKSRPSPCSLCARSLLALKAAPELFIAVVISEFLSRTFCSLSVRQASVMHCSQTEKFWTTFMMCVT